MLRLWFKDEEDYKSCGLELVSNVEVEFLRIPLEPSSVNRKVMQLLEQGKWQNSKEYTDRFGIRRSIQNISTGSKALLVVENSVGKLVDMMEAGFNAVSLGISVCTRGDMLIPDYQVEFLDELQGGVVVRVDNYIFSDVGRLNRYIFQWLYQRSSMLIIKTCSTCQILGKDWFLFDDENVLKYAFDGSIVCRDIW